MGRYVRRGRRSAVGETSGDLLRALHFSMRLVPKASLLAVATLLLAGCQANWGCDGGTSSCNGGQITATVIIIGVVVLALISGIFGAAVKRGYRQKAGLPPPKRLDPDPGLRSSLTDENGGLGTAGSGSPPQRGAVGERNSRIIRQDVRIAVAVRDHGMCVRCGSAEDLHYDHKIPWSRGGANTVNNIQLLCGRCNRIKGADDIPV